MDTSTKKDTSLHQIKRFTVFFKLNNDHPQITSNQFENSLYLNEYNILITIIYYFIYNFFC
ncbi:hypothetical protein EAJ07_10120 [Bacteroides ovatus]|nr:hypothetical protein DXD69_06935 [Bacteroides ovatus]RGQ82388.1 hypothetical protein DWY80_16645 [Bacteroides ovatus]RGV96293.1 hypothetical protein DWV98_21445 [Bacteroides ovatus]RYT73292.1 hypothetical protein EAJ07_10120 [Bacteroides ovatus]